MAVGRQIVRIVGTAQIVGALTSTGEAIHLVGEIQRFEAQAEMVVQFIGGEEVQCQLRILGVELVIGPNPGPS